MTRQTFHCFCGFASDDPGECPTCGDQLHPKRTVPLKPKEKMK